MSWHDIREWKFGSWISVSPTTSGRARTHSEKDHAGTNNLLREAAMTRTQATEALQVGIDLATEAAQEGSALSGPGKWGSATRLKARASRRHDRSTGC